MTELLTDSDIAVLNAARSILVRVSKDAMAASFDLDGGWAGAGVGRLGYAADAAEHLIFDTLSTAKHYAGVPVSDSQVHNSHADPEPEPVAQMQGWLDFTALDLQQVQERIDSLAPKLDPDGEREWSLLHDTSRQWYLKVSGDGRLFKLDGPVGESVRVLRPRV